MTQTILSSSKKYSIIYADPPWVFKNYSDRWHEEHDQSRWVGKQYDLMTSESVASIPVSNISNTDCALFLWATYPSLPLALRTMDMWGFQYKTVAFTWIKTNKVKTNSLFWGMGFWTRSNAEICLLGTKGSLKRANRGVHSIIMSPVRAHSQKPDEVRERIVQLLGDLPRIELFARGKLPEGWDGWGLEVES